MMNAVRLIQNDMSRSYMCGQSHKIITITHEEPFGTLLS